MKKILLAVLAFSLCSVMILSFTSCGKTPTEEELIGYWKSDDGVFEMTIEDDGEWHDKYTDGWYEIDGSKVICHYTKISIDKSGKTNRYYREIAYKFKGGNLVHPNYTLKKVN